MNREMKTTLKSAMWKSDFEKQQEELRRQLRREGLLWLAIGLAALVVLVLSGCGGGAGALPFGASGPQESTQPVTCAPAGCAK